MCDGRLVIRVAVDVAVASVGARLAAELGDVGARGAVDQQQQRDPDPDEQPGEGVEDRHAEQRRDRGDEVGASREPELAPEALGVGAVQLDQRAVVDELDHRGDHDRRERRFGEVFEQPRQREQREDRQRRDDQPRRAACARRPTR